MNPPKLEEIAQDGIIVRTLKKTQKYLQKYFPKVYPEEKSGLTSYDINNLRKLKAQADRKRVQEKNITKSYSHKWNGS